MCVMSNTSHLPVRTAETIQEALNQDLKTRLRRVLSGKEYVKLRRLLIHRILDLGLIVPDPEYAGRPIAAHKVVVSYSDNGNLNINSENMLIENHHPFNEDGVNPDEMLLRSMSSAVNQLLVDLDIKMKASSPSAGIRMGNKTYLISIEPCIINLDQAGCALQEFWGRGEPDPIESGATHLTFGAQASDLPSGSMANLIISWKILRAIISMARVGSLTDCDIATLGALLHMGKSSRGIDLTYCDLIAGSAASLSACNDSKKSLDKLAAESLEKLEKLRLAWPHYKPARELKFSKRFCFSV